MTRYLTTVLSALILVSVQLQESNARSSHRLERTKRRHNYDTDYKHQFHSRNESYSKRLQGSIASIKNNEEQTRSSRCSFDCDTRYCKEISPDSCRGRITKDHCGCCPVCNDEAGEESIYDRVIVIPTGNVCMNLTCPRYKVCTVNIQGLPMCRCPNIYWCKKSPKKPLCSSDGVMYKNRCFLELAECEQNRKIVAHKRNCVRANRRASEDRKSSNEVHKKHKRGKKNARKRAEKKQRKFRRHARLFRRSLIKHRD